MTPELYHSLAMCFLDEKSDRVKEMASCCIRLSEDGYQQSI